MQKNNVEEKLRMTMANLADKKVEKISVSELCKKAGISRASFYIYYDSLDDLIKKTRDYVIEKMHSQLSVILDIKDGAEISKDSILFSDTDISLLKGFTEKHVYWDFAIDANNIIAPRCRKKMIERWGEEYYRENEEVFEFMINGGAAMLYLDLVDFDKEKYIRNMNYITGIAKELFPVP